MKQAEVEHVLKRLAPELDIRVALSGSAGVFNIRWVAVSYADFNPAPHNLKLNADTLRRLTRNAQRSMFPEANELEQLRAQVEKLEHENKILKSLISEGMKDHDDGFAEAGRHRMGFCRPDCQYCPTTEAA